MNCHVHMWVSARARELYLGLGQGLGLNKSSSMISTVSRARANRGGGMFDVTIFLHISIGNTNDDNHLQSCVGCEGGGGVFAYSNKQNIRTFKSPQDFYFFVILTFNQQNELF